MKLEKEEKKKRIRDELLGFSRGGLYPQETRSRVTFLSLYIFRVWTLLEHLLSFITLIRINLKSNAPHALSAKIELHGRKPRPLQKWYQSDGLALEA